MLFYNLNKPSEKADFKTATIQGLGSDKGLFFPERIPVIPSSWINNIGNYSKEEIALQVMKPYVGESIPELILRQIVAETIGFDIPSGFAFPKYQYPGIIPWAYPGIQRCGRPLYEPLPGLFHERSGSPRYGAGCHFR